MQTSASVGRHTLQRKVAIIVVAGLAASFGLFGFLALEAVRESTQAVFQERLMMARFTADHIDYQLKEALDYLQAASRSGIDLHDGNPLPEQAALAEIRARLPIFAQQVYLVDRSGAVVMVEPQPSALEGANVFDYVHIRRTLEGSRAEVSGAVLNPNTRKPEVVLAVPVTNSAGRTTAVLAASVDIARASLAGLILGLKPGNTGRTEILDGNGTVMASTEPGRVLQRSRHHDLLFSLIRQKSAAVVSHQTEDEGLNSFSEVVAFAPLAHASWGVAVEQSEDEALAVRRDLATRLVVLGLLSLLGALTTGVLVLRSVLVPIRSLTLASERIAAGDLDGQLSIEGEDEVGRLARTFESMRARLKQSREELDRWHRELELRVQQRTSELSCLFELSKTIAFATDLDDMTSAIIQRVVEILEPSEAAYLYLVDPAGHRLVLRSWQGDLPEGLSPYYLAVASLAFNSRHPIHCPSSEQPPDFVDSLHETSGSRGSEVPAPNAGALTCAPLLIQGRALGALLLRCGGRGDGCTPADLRLVQALADQVAVAIERAQLAREAEQAAALREADRLKSQFISTITHELQSPLGFIKGYATTLLRRDSDFDEKTRREFLQIISEESDSLSALIDDLLDVSRIEAGALSVERQPVPVAGLVRRSVERVRAKSETHDFHLRLPAMLPVVEADARRLEQVLRNLLDNAVKYSPEGRTITVSAAVQDGSVVVAVADQGIGIPPEEQKRVFERFYRGRGATGVTRRGAGLGLSICRGIIEAHGGRIWLESSPGRGTTVSFSVPVGAGPASRPPSPAGDHLDAPAGTSRGKLGPGIRLPASAGPAGR